MRFGIWEYTGKDGAPPPPTESSIISTNKELQSISESRANSLINFMIIINTQWLCIKNEKKIEYKSNVIVIGPTSSPRMKIFWLVTLHVYFLPYCEGMTDSGTPFWCKVQSCKTIARLEFKGLSEHQNTAVGKSIKCMTFFMMVYFEQQLFNNQPSNLWMDLTDL